MCGRFSIHLADLSALSEALGVTRSGIEVWEPRFNVAPTQRAPIVRREQSERVLALAHFGLVPHWADDPAVGARMINARSETVATKPAFRDAFKRHRCIVPVTGYFEWKPEPGRRKQPMWLHPNPDHAPGTEPLMWLAGLWSRWYPKAKDDAEPGEPAVPFDSFCILTRAATGIVAPIHDRMPVALPRDLAMSWLGDGDSGAQLEAALAAPTDAQALTATPVSVAVNSPRNDGPECIAEVTPVAERQLPLF